MEDPSTFAGRIHRLIRLGLSLEEAPEEETQAEQMGDLPVTETEELDASAMEDVD